MQTIDALIHKAVFAKDNEKQKTRLQIAKLAKEKGIFSASIYPFYMTMGKGKVKGFTVPAMNVRMMTYDTAQVIFELMKKHSIGPVVFEIARSEITYTDQRPEEYTTVVLAAAIKAGYKGPVFLQGDHYQLSKNKFNVDKNAEVQRIKDLIDESLKALFFNIDIDASTLVDLTQESIAEQQRNNFEVTAELTKHIRSQEQTMISIGGEIGHIGGKNSTVSDFEAFMHGYQSLVKQNGLSKVSVQTGTSHGGIPLPDGTIAKVNLDFSVLKDISSVARKKFGLAGAVQHGASTLPKTLFGEFPKNDTAEIHLATGFQNIVYDTMPKSLRDEMHEWTRKNCLNEKEDGWNDEQFVYKCRKKAIGPFKQQLWDLSEKDKLPIKQALEKEFNFLFEKLNIFSTRETLLKYVS